MSGDLIQTQYMRVGDRIPLTVPFIQAAVCKVHDDFEVG